MGYQEAIKDFETSMEWTREVEGAQNDPPLPRAIFDLAHGLKELTEQLRKDIGNLERKIKP